MLYLFNRASSFPRTVIDGVKTVTTTTGDTVSVIELNYITQITDLVNNCHYPVIIDVLSKPLYVKESDGRERVISNSILVYDSCIE